MTVLTNKKHQKVWISIITVCVVLAVLLVTKGHSLQGTKGLAESSWRGTASNQGNVDSFKVSSSSNQGHVDSFRASSSSSSGRLNVETSYFIKQRNDLAIKLNEQKKLFGQQSCEMRSMRVAAGDKTGELNLVSDNGGWCQQISGSDSKLHLTDYGFAKAVSKFLKGKHVGSFGDGPGDYKKALDSYMEVASYTAYDGAPFCEKTTQGMVNFLDLSGPQFGLKAFDWVISVEVGEHIPVKYEDIYLDNLVRHAKEGIILSWAVPGQGGTSHVNLQTLDHVVWQMQKRGFNLDRDGGEPLRSASGASWLKKNVHVYRRVDQASFNPNDV